MVAQEMLAQMLPHPLPVMAGTELHLALVVAALHMQAEAVALEHQAEQEALVEQVVAGMVG